MSDKLASWLNRKLEETDWSIRQFSRRVGISHTHAGRIVNGDVNPSAEICVAIANAFGVPTEQVLRLVDILPEIDRDDAELEALMSEWRQLSLEDRIATYHMARSLNQTRQQRDNKSRAIGAVLNQKLAHP